MNVKKLLSTLLAAAMVITLAPLNVFAVEPSTATAPAEDLTPGPVTNGLVDGSGNLKSGGIRIEKSAERTENPDEYEITLKVESKDVKINDDAYVVLVIDNSGSMNDKIGRTRDTFLSKTKKAAKEFVDRLLVEGSQAKIAVVSFSGNSNRVANFTGYEGKNDLKNKIGNLSANGGTYMQAGIHEAKNLLSDVDSQNKTIVLLGDGEPTYSTKVSSVNASVISNWIDDFLGIIGHWEDHWTINSVTFESGRTGNGSDNGYDYGIFGNKYYTLDRKTVEAYNQHHDKRTTKYPDSHNEPTIYEAGLAKAAGIGIYSVGLGLSNGSGGANVLRECQNKGLVLNDGTGLEDIFNNLAMSIQDTMKNYAVTDPMGDYIVLDESSINLTEAGEGASAPVATVGGKKQITWNPGTVNADSKGVKRVVLKYKVKLDTEAADFNKNIAHDANGTTTLSYQDKDGHDHSLDFEIPKLVGTYGSIYKVGVLVNDNGVYLDEGGNVTDDPAEAKVIASQMEVVNPKNNANQWAIGTHDVSLDGLNPEEEGYSRYKGDLDTKEAEIAADKLEDTVYFKYVPKAVTVTIQHIDAHTNSPILGVADVIESGASGSLYTVEAKTIPGYRIREGQADERTFGSSDETVSVLYDKEFSVTYIADDVTAPVDSNAYIENEQVTVLAGPEKEGYTFAGWKLDDETSDLLGGNTFSMPYGDVTLTAVYTPKNNTTYSVEHYKQNIDGSYPTDVFETESKYGTTGSPVTAVSKAYEGFTLDLTVDGTQQTGTIAADGSTVLKLYYARKQYTVTFTTNGNGTLNDGTDPIVSPAYYQDAFPAVPTPIPTGDYEFKGWQRNGTGDLIDPITETVVTESVTYTAIFEEIPKFTVSFKFVDAPTDAPSVPAPITDVLRGSTVSRPADPDFAGYDFDGWYKDQACKQGFNFGNDGDAIIQSITLYGKFSAKSVDYIINHLKEDRNNLGQYLDPVDVDTGSEDVGETITANANAYTGYELVGEESAQTHQVVAGDVGSTIVLEFKYDLIPYTVTFRPGDHGTLTGAGEDGNVVNSPVYYDDALNAPEVTVTTNPDAVYTFIGWDSDDDGNVDYTSENLPSVAGDATYTAVYTSQGVYTYTIEHWVQDAEEPFLTHTGTAVEGDTVSVAPEQVEKALAKLGNDYQTVGDPYSLSLTIPEGDNILVVYYEKKPDSNITVVHKYYLNNTTVENEVSKNAGIVDPGAEVDAADYQEPGSYTYWKTEIERTEIPEENNLPSAANEMIKAESSELTLNAEKSETAAELEAKIKEDRAQVLKDHPDATEEEIDQWIAEYGATMVDDRYQTLKDKLDDLNARISELEPEDKDDGSSSDSERSDSSEASSSEASSNEASSSEASSSEASSSEASSSEASSSEASSSEASSSEASSSEASSSEASSSEASSSEASSSEASSSEASSSEASSSEASSSEASSSEASSSEDQAKLLAELKKEHAEVQDQFDDLVETRDKYEFIKPLYAHTKALSELTGVPMTLATVDYQVAETVIWPPLDGKFTYEDSYAYTITISYNRVVQDNDDDDDDNDDNDDDDDDDDSGRTIIINNPRVPLAQLPQEELVTILDQDVPLGNLPKTGGSAENAVDSLGAMAMVLGILMKIFGKSHKGDQ